MQYTMKRGLSFLLALCMVFGLIPAMTIGASAAGAPQIEANLIIGGTTYDLATFESSGETWDFREAATLKIKLTVDPSTNRKLSVTIAPGLRWVTWDDNSSNSAVLSSVRDGSSRTQIGTDFPGASLTQLGDGTVNFDLVTSSSEITFSMSIAPQLQLFDSTVKDLITDAIKISYTDSAYPTATEVEGDISLSRPVPTTGAGYGIGYYNFKRSTGTYHDTPVRLQVTLNRQGDSSVHVPTLVEKLTTTIQVPKGAVLSNPQVGDAPGASGSSVPTLVLDATKSASDPTYDYWTLEREGFYHTTGMIPMYADATFPTSIPWGTYQITYQDTEITIYKTGVAQPALVTSSNYHITDIHLLDPSIANFTVATPTFGVAYNAAVSATTDLNVTLGILEIKEIGQGTGDIAGPFNFEVSVNPDELFVRAVTIPCDGLQAGAVPTTIVVTDSTGTPHTVFTAGLYHFERGIMVTLEDVPGVPAGASIKSVNATIPSISIGYAQNVTPNTYRTEAHKSTTQLGGKVIGYRMDNSLTEYVVNYKWAGQSYTTKSAINKNLPINTSGTVSTNKVAPGGSVSGTLTLVYRNDVACSAAIIDPVTYFTLPTGMTVRNVVVSDETGELSATLTRDAAKSTAFGGNVYALKLTQANQVFITADSEYNHHAYQLAFDFVTDKTISAQSFSLNDLIVVVSGVDSYGSNASSNYTRSDTGSIFNGGKQMTAGPKTTTFSVGEEKILALATGMKLDTETDYYTYDGTESTKSIMATGAKSQLHIDMKNATDGTIKNVKIYIPIPQKNENLGSAFQDAAHQFTMKLDGAPVASDLTANVSYVTVAPGTYDYDNLPVTTPATQATANMVLVEIPTMAMGAGSTIDVEYTTTETVSDIENLFRVFYYYENASGAKNAPSAPEVCAVLQNGVVSGNVYLDKDANGKKGSGDTGVADVIVVVATNASGFTRSTVTDASGNYEIKGMKTKEPVVVTFTNPTNGDPRLDGAMRLLTTTEGVIATANADGSKAATAAFKLEDSSDKATVNAALIEPFVVTFNPVGGTSVNPTSIKRFAGQTIGEYSQQVTVITGIGENFNNDWAKLVGGASSTVTHGNLLQEVITANTTYTPNITATSNVVSFMGWDTTTSTMVQKDSETVNYGGYISAFPNLTGYERPGYDLTGWSVNGTATIIPNTAAGRGQIQGTPVTGAVNYIAQYTEKSNIAVIMDANGGKIDGAATKTYTGVYNTPISYNAPTRAGYSFLGWASTKAKADAENADLGKFPTYPTANATYFAAWEANDITVYLNANGGTLSGSFASGSITDKTGAPMVLPTDGAGIARSGYTLSGWAWQSGTASTSVYPTANGTLIAQWTPVQESITFVLTDGAYVKPNIVVTGAHGGNLSATDIAALDAAAVARGGGYTLTGWNNGTKTILHANISEIVINAGDTYTAVWQSGVTKITLDAQGGQFANGDSTRTFNGSAGEIMYANDVAAPTKAGNTFQGWFAAPTGGTALTQFAFPGTGTDTYYAQWKTAEYTVTFQFNGGSDGSSDAYSTELVLHGGNATAPTLTPPVGATQLDKWVDALTGTEYSEAQVNALAITEDMTFYAKWDPLATHSVKFYGYNGVNTDFLEFNVITGGALPYTGATTSEAGKTFLHWQVVTPAGGLLVNGSSKTELALTDLEKVSVSEDIVLSAVFGDSDVNLSFSTPEGSLSSNMNKSVSVNYVLQASDFPAITGTSKTHIGWFFNGTTKTAAQWDGTTVTESMSFVAQFAGDVAVSFDGNGGTVAGSTLITDAAGTLKTPPTATRPGYTFSKWNTAPNGSGTNLTITGGQFTMPSTSVTYYAIWTVQTRSVTFAAGANGTISSAATIQVDYNAPITAVKVPTATANTDYTFAGWKATEGGNEVGVFTSAQVGSYVVTANVTFTAQFTENQKATVIFNFGGGTDGASNSYTMVTGHAGKTLTAPTGITKIGYTQNGWTPAVPGAYGAAGSVSIYTAQWTANTYTAVFKDSNPANNTATTTISTENVSFDSAIGAAKVPVDPSKVGYDFIGWSDGSGLYSANAVAAYVMNNTAGLTFVAQYARSEKHTAVFDFNGGTNAGGDAYVSLTDYQGASFVVPTGITKAGYVFAAWSPVVSSTVHGAPGTVDTYVAQWTAKSNTVTYQASYATLSSTTEQVDTDDYLAMIPTVTADAGYTFQDQWICSLGGTYTTAELNSYLVTEPVTFIAVLVPNGSLATDQVLTFDANGGTNAPAALTVAKDSVISLTAMVATAPAGQHFIGWADAATGGAMVTTVTMNSDKTVYAQYATDPALGTFDVTFNKGLHGDQDNTDTTAMVQTITAGDTVIDVPVMVADTDYTHVGWQINGLGDVLTDAAIKLIPVTGDVTYVAAYVKTVGEAVYTLHFDANGGSNAPADITLPENTVLNISYFTANANAGETFAGWANAATGGTMVTSITFTGDQTVYAQYNTIPDYTVSFYEEDGTTLIVDEIVAEDDTVLAVPAAPAIAGYTFIGWQVNGTGALFTDAAILLIPVTADVDYVAAYSDDSIVAPGTFVTLTFDADIGSGAPAPITVPAGTTISLGGYTATPAAGDAFIGWSETLGGAVITSYNLTADTTIYAKYQTIPAPATYTVSFEQGAHGTLATNPTLETVTDGDPVGAVPTVTADTDYIFAGWQVNGTGPVFTDAAILLIPVTGNIDYVAFYRDADPAITTSYTLTFAAGIGSNAPAAITLPAGTTVSVNAYVATAPAGYIFTGWMDSSNNVVTSVTLTANETLTAQYVATNPGGPFAVTFFAGSNGTMAPVTYTENVASGSTVTSVPVITANSSYTFLGWSLNGGSSYYSSADVASMAITGVSVFTARYQQTTISGGSSGGGVTTYKITASAGAGGSISPDGRVSIVRNADATFAFTPDKGYEVEDVIVDGKSVGARSSYTFENVTKAHTISVSFVTAIDDGKTPLDGGQRYDDVSPDDWFYDAVEYVSEEELMNGIGNNLFGPNLNTTRAMVITILYRLEGRPAVSGKTVYSDVAENMWFTDAVIWGTKTGVIKGYDDGRYGPEDYVTREQLALIIYRYAGFKGYNVSETTNLSAYTDAAQVSGWALDGVRWANATGLMVGQTATTLNPGAPATRAQLAMIVMRLCEAQEK